LLSNQFVFLQPEAEGDPEGDDANKDVDIIGDDMQTTTGRHAEAEMPMTEVPTVRKEQGRADFVHYPQSYFCAYAEVIY
jgi:hypothetical protein